MNRETYLSSILTTKENIRNAIINRNITIEEDVKFKDYPTYIDKIDNSIYTIQKADSGVSTLPSSTNWLSICYGNGKYVAISGTSSGSDISAYSIDGINWTQTTLPSSVWWHSVCYGNDKFVAVTYNNSIAAYSTDGINWSQTNLPSSDWWLSVCYGNGKYIAVAGNTTGSTAAAYSIDGINWTQTTLPSKVYWRSVCYGNGKYVAITGGSSGSSIAAYSTDGISWTQTTLPTSARWYSVCYGNGKYIAVAGGSSSTTTAYSTDGITWTRTTLPSSANWYSVCYGNGKYVVVTYNSTKAAYSEDGINWTVSTFPSAKWYSVCYGNGKYVAITGGNSGSVTAAYSTDGINWNNYTNIEESVLSSYKDSTDTIIHQGTELIIDPRTVAINKCINPWVHSLTVSGTIATSTYYSYCNVVYDSFDPYTIYIIMKSNTSTSYENLYFTIDSIPSNITNIGQTVYNYSSASTSKWYAIGFSGVTCPIKVSINMNSLNSTYDYVQCGITIEDVIE